MLVYPKSVIWFWHRNNNSFIIDKFSAQKTTYNCNISHIVFHCQVGCCSIMPTNITSTGNMVTKFRMLCKKNKERMQKTIIITGYLPNIWQIKKAYFKKKSKKYIIYTFEKRKLFAKIYAEKFAGRYKWAARREFIAIVINKVIAKLTMPLGTIRHVYFIW